MNTLKIAAEPKFTHKGSQSGDRVILISKILDNGQLGAWGFTVEDLGKTEGMLEKALDNEIESLLEKAQLDATWDNDPFNYKPKGHQMSCYSTSRIKFSSKEDAKSFMTQSGLD